MAASDPTTSDLPVKSSVILGFSQGMQFFVYALGYYAGAHFIALGLTDFAGFFRCLMAVVLASRAGGFANANAMDGARGEAAKRHIFSILDLKSDIDPLQPRKDGDALPGPVTGKLEFRGVHFAYPSRPTEPVLRGLNLVIQPGETVALVGASGSGKSTTVALLERFYDPAAGEVLIDGVPLKQLHPGWLREQEGLVSQEPALFQDSIAYNIEYGAAAAAKPEPDQGVSANPADGTTIPAGFSVPPAVRRAAEDANAAEFIDKLGYGFATNVGVGGSLLSGGQKQRVAIARALLRNPRILLLDEATAALDTQSEAVVQAALDRLVREQRGAASRRTTLIIAHRLSTVRDADRICVLEKGVLVEQGTHDELLAVEGGRYRALALQQEPTLLQATAAAAGAGGPQGGAMSTRRIAAQLEAGKGSDSSSSSAAALQ